MNKLKILKRKISFILYSLKCGSFSKRFKLNLKKDAKFILYEYKNKDGINYCLKDERGEVLMNIESSAALGDRILIMTESFNRKGFEVQFIKK